MLSWIQCAAILRHRISDVSQIVYVIGALLEKAKLGGGLAHNCDSDVSKPRRTGYIKQVEYPWTDVGCWNVHAPVT